MRKPYCIAVIGKNFGDEGKGLATDYFSNTEGSVLGVRHNGGAQSGHTVEIKESDKRFVFHELSSGSFRSADTFWASTYFPDIYKLRDEIEAFKELSGFIPRIFASEKTNITIIDDVLLNMAVETKRGDARHGSCGMGIWEATLRTEAGYGISLGELKQMDGTQLTKRLATIRHEYTKRRMEELKIETNTSEYLELLSNDNVLENFAEEVISNLSLVQVISEKNVKSFFEGYNRLVFEGGQGLLLDAENNEYAPHVSASRTGLTNPVKLLKELDWELDEAVYVTRSYLTRHGAGPFENECEKSKLGNIAIDMTNQPNEFQGSIRYGFQFPKEEFLKPVNIDLSSVQARPGKLSLMITHLNEVSLGKEYESGFDRIYYSSTKYSEDISYSNNT